MLRRFRSIICVLATGVLFHTGSIAATLDDITYASLPGDRVQLEMKLSESLSGDPLNFTIDNPARIVFDFPDTSLNLSQKNQSIGIGVAHSVSAVEAAGRTRVVLNLVESVGYDMDVRGNTLVVTLGAATEASKGAGSMSSITSKASGPSDSSIENIDFRRGPAGEGRIIVTLSDPSAAVNLSKEGENVIVDFINTSLPDQLNRRLDVIDFATPVKEVDTSPMGNGSRMTVSTTTAEYDHLAYQSDNVLTIEFKPLSRAEQEEKNLKNLLRKIWRA